MYCTYYRPANTNTAEFENIIGKLSYDLHLLKTEEQDEWSVYSYFYALSRQAKPLESNPEMKFFGFATPEAMPADARVDYFYRPTYIATAFMMQSILRYPSLLDAESFLDSELDFDPEIVKSTLKSCMLACTGRGFDGAGVLRLKDCIKIFQDAGADEFLEKYPDICPKFSALYHEKKAFVDSGNVDICEFWH